MTAIPEVYALPTANIVLPEEGSFDEMMAHLVERVAALQLNRFKVCWARTYDSKHAGVFRIAHVNSRAVARLILRELKPELHRNRKL